MNLCCVLQVVPLPSCAQRRVLSGHVHHSSGPESQYAHLCGSYCYAANGASRWRDGHCERSDTSTVTYSGATGFTVTAITITDHMVAPLVFPAYYSISCTFTHTHISLTEMDYGYHSMS